MFLILLTLTACAPTRPPAFDPNGPLPAATAADALLPDRLVVHPLTRIARGPDGKPVAIVYLELLDRFDQNTRALGRVRLHIVPPGQGASESESRAPLPPESVWTIELTTPELNARYFDDLVSRTYTVTLGDLPEWLVDRAANPDSDTNPPTLAAEFIFADSTGSIHTLRDTARLTR